jgi:SH3-like domain-containing protein
MGHRMGPKLAAAALGAAFSLAGGLTGDLAQAGPERPTPSGLPVPRYVSLKFDKVNARSGPGDDHRLLWVYRVRGLPMQVVAETSEWRRVCDPEGELAWVHKRTTDGRRTVMNVSAVPVPLRRRPKEVSHLTAYLRPRALAALLRCEDGWCRVRAGEVTGWVRPGDLWGASEAVQCRAGGRPQDADGH